MKLVCRPLRSAQFQRVALRGARIAAHELMTYVEVQVGCLEYALHSPMSTIVHGTVSACRRALTRSCRTTARTNHCSAGLLKYRRRFFKCIGGVQFTPCTGRSGWRTYDIPMLIAHPHIGLCAADGGSPWEINDRPVLWSFRAQRPLGITHSKSRPTPSPLNKPGYLPYRI